MKIYGIKAKQVMAGPGVWAVVAEAEVGEAGCENVYVAIQEYDGLDMTVSKQSMYDFLCGDGEDPAEEFLEEYSTMSEASASAYAEVFKQLKNVMKVLG